MYFLGFAGLLATLFVPAVLSAYVLNPDDNYQGNTFFDKFNFFTATDPTMGFVQYQDQSTASNSKLISINEAQQAYIGVDSQNTYDVNSPHGRQSVRLETKKTYQYGLFVLDLAHMPSNTCGSWPAFWTTNEQDWPRWGEIDILENIHENTRSLEALHTAPGCSVSGNQVKTQMLGKQNTYNCDGGATSSQYGTQGLGQGCAAENTNPNNYGSEFNGAGGGVYAMEWNKQAISIWHFPRSGIPQDLASGTPNPSGWGQPVFTSAQGSCDIDGHFKDQKIIIDHTFCGNWAGQDAFWQQTSCYKSNPTQFPTCSSYVAANPAAYKESYWLVNSMKIYQDNAANSIAPNQFSLASAMDPEPSMVNNAEPGPNQSISSELVTSDSTPQTVNSATESSLTKDSSQPPSTSAVVSSINSAIESSSLTKDSSQPSSTSAVVSSVSPPLNSATSVPLSHANSSLPYPNSLSGSVPLQSFTASSSFTASRNSSESSSIATKTLVPLYSSPEIKTSSAGPTTTFESVSGASKSWVTYGSFLFSMGAFLMRVLI